MLNISFLSKNKIKTIRLAIFLSAFLVTFLGVAGKSNAAWQEDLEGQFDIVETFDQLQDWAPNPSGAIGEENSNLPLLLDGSSSMWDSWDYWAQVPSNEIFIGNHGAQYVWQGTKSLAMDIEGPGERVGPQRFGMYFGGNTPDEINGYNNSGIEESGYRGDVYFFQMLRFRPDTFPTPPDSGGNWYMKFHVMSKGFNSASLCSDCPDPSYDYGCANIHTNIKGTVGEYVPLLQWFSRAGCPGGWDDIDELEGIAPTEGMYEPENPEAFMPDDVWFGLEVRIHNGAPGVADSYQEYWMYDADGTAHYIAQSNLFVSNPAGINYGFNNFFFGGNLSYDAVIVEQGLSTVYYVDDFIINDQRIGPAYFSLLNGTADTTAPNSPSGLSVL